MNMRPPPKVENRRWQAKPLAEWTVMVYMAGDNNLSADCVWALTEMQKGMASDKINVIAQFDPSDGLARTRRYHITSKGVIHDNRQARSKPGVEAPADLDHLEKGTAEWNPRTEEVHFRKESKRARSLARHRRGLNRAHWKFAQKIMKQGRALNANLKPDDLGSSRSDTDSASPITLYNFLSYGIEFCPARHYMVVLSGHSAGIEPNYLLKDESSGGSMTFRQLRAVLEQLKKDDLGDKRFKGRAKKIDILGFDTCLMSMAEVCYDLRDLVDIVIGSETYTPSSGWPYQSILRDLCQSVEPSDDSDPSPFAPSKLAEVIVRKYMEFYRPYVTSGVSVALSALDVTMVGKLPRLVERLSLAFIRELKAEHPELKGKPEKRRRPFTDALVLAHWEAQSYNGEWYVDLVDFCECLKKRYPKQQIRDRCEALVRFLKDKFIIISDVTGATYQHSHGVAIYFPWSSVATYLWGFEFATLSRWGDFLAYYTNLTRRKFRVPDEHDLQDQDAAERELTKERVKALDKLGGNFVNYDRKADRLALVKRTSDKRTSDKLLNIADFNRMVSHKRTSDKRTSDKRTSDKMGADRSGNPIHSMRNPPIVSIDFDS